LPAGRREDGRNPAEARTRGRTAACPKRRGELAERIDPEVGPRRFRPARMQDPPRSPAREHAEHPRFPGRQHVVVEEIADVGRLLGRDERPPLVLTARIPPRRCPPIQEAPMVKVHIWLRRKEDTTPEEFAEYWLSTHSAIARDGYENLRGYVVSIVTRVPDGQEAPYDGVAELSWEDRDGFSADMKSEAARRSTEDLKNFTRDVGLLFVEQTVVK
jgi:uncharacterized protein (TIGR02118 family)